MSRRRKLQATIKSAKRLFSGFFKLDEYVIEVERHNGGSMEVARLILERGHAVAILAYDPRRDEVLLVNEMRPGCLVAGDDPFSDALPAGMIDAAESEMVAARRELMEETGMIAEDMRMIHKGAYCSSGGSSERIGLVLAIVDMAKAGGIHGEVTEGEDIKSVVYDARDFIRAADEGAIKDMKALLAANWLARNRIALQKEFTAIAGNDNVTSITGT